jgi:hypothetical protein
MSILKIEMGQRTCTRESTSPWTTLDTRDSNIDLALSTGQLVPDTVPIGRLSLGSSIKFPKSSSSSNSLKEGTLGLLKYTKFSFVEASTTGSFPTQTIKKNCTYHLTKLHYFYFAIQK